VRPRRVTVRSAILTPLQVERLQAIRELGGVRLSLTFRVDGGEAAFERALEELAAAACRAVADGAALVVLSDRNIDADHAALPSLLATSAVHHALIAQRLRLRASIVVESGDARDPHQVAALCAYGASAVYPYLGYETVAAR